MYPLAALLALCFATPQSGPAPTTPASITELTLDQLIEQLPRVGRESKWNRETMSWDDEPAVDEFSRRLSTGVKLTDAQWQRALTRTGVFRARSKWPATRPLAVSMEMPSWLPVTKIVATPLNRGLQQAKAESVPIGGCGAYDEAVYRKALHQELGMLGLGEHNIMFDVTIDVRGDTRFLGRSKRALAGPPLGMLWNGPLPVQVEIVPTIDEAIPPVSGPELDAAVRASLGVAYADWGQPERRAAILVIDPDTKAHPLLADVGLSLKVSIEYRGKALESMHLTASRADPLALFNSVSEGEEQTIAFAASSAIPGSTDKMVAERDGWVIRITGTSDGVEALWGTSKRWSGTVEISLDEAIRQDVARTGPKGRGPWMWIPR